MYNISIEFNIQLEHLTPYYKAPHGVWQGFILNAIRLG